MAALKLSRGEIRCSLQSGIPFFQSESSRSSRVSFPRTQRFTIMAAAKTPLKLEKVHVLTKKQLDKVCSKRFR